MRATARRLASCARGEQPSYITHVQHTCTTHTHSSYKKVRCADDTDEQVVQC